MPLIGPRPCLWHSSGMRVVGLTGGIGSGKSSVSERLARLGAQIVDADAIVHELQQPGQPVFLAMVRRWGDRIVLPQDSIEPGSLNRAAVAGIVFSDKAELKALEAMVHPAVKAEVARRVEAARGSDSILILDNPLLVKKGQGGEVVPGSAEADLTPKADPATDGANKTDASNGGWPATSALIVVDCPVETAIKRLMEFRGFDRQDAQRRIDAQASRSERLALADFVIHNNGDLEDLDDEVAACWAWLESVPHI